MLISKSLRRFCLRVQRAYLTCAALFCVCRLAKDLEIKTKLEEEAKAKAEAAAADNKVPLSPTRPWTCKHQGMRA
jgi:hypothetical protein